MQLADKTCLIVGASGAIGSAVASRFYREGARLALTRRLGNSNFAAMNLPRPMASTGDSRIETLDLDVRHWNDVQTAVARVERRWGPIHVLVNCSGVLGPVGPVESAPVDAWREAIEINLIGSFYLVRAVVPSMRAVGGGKIILFSGGGAAYARPFFTAYSSSKAAVVRFAESLAGELSGHNIQVNAIAPGPVKSRMWEELRARAAAAGPRAIEELSQMDVTGGVKPECAASLALFLASNSSEGLTGRLISAVHDPWEEMASRIPQIMASDRGTLRRIPLD